jgi:hypothetical protein
MFSMTQLAKDFVLNSPYTFQRNCEFSLTAVLRSYAGLW